MSSCVGVVFIDNCSSIITVGDGNKLTPKTAVSLYSGAGRFDIGEVQVIINKQNITKVVDNDVIDQGFILNL